MATKNTKKTTVKRPITKTAKTVAPRVGKTKRVAKKVTKK